VDTFDYKPALSKHHGQEVQGSNTIVPFNGKRGTVLKSPWAFRQYGKSGKWVSDLLPHIGRCSDDLTFVHSMVSRSNAHGPALFQLSTGFLFQGFPSAGSWISYGLGSLNDNLPSFVVLPDPRGLPPCGAALWGNASCLPLTRASYSGRSASPSPTCGRLPASPLAIKSPLMTYFPT